MVERAEVVEAAVVDHQVFEAAHRLIPWAPAMVVPRILHRGAATIMEAIIRTAAAAVLATEVLALGAATMVAILVTWTDRRVIDTYPGRGAPWELRIHFDTIQEAEATV